MGYAEENTETEMNWDDVGITIPKDAKFDIEVEKATYAFREKSGAHGANVTFNIVSVYDEEHTKYENKKVFENFTFSQAAGFNVKKFMKMAEVEFPRVISKDVIEAWCEEILGKRVGIVTKHEEFNGDTRAKIKSYFIEGTGGDTERKEKKEEEKEEEETEATVEEEEEEKDDEEEEEEDEDDDNNEDEDEEEEKEEEEEPEPPKTDVKKKSLKEAAQASAKPAKKAAAPAPALAKKAAAAARTGKFNKK